MIAGIDFSTHAIDTVLLDEDTDRATWHRRRLDTAPGDAFEAARRVRDAMPARGRWLDTVIAIGIEEPAGQGTTPLVRVQGAILACLPVTLLIQPLYPVTWKKHSVGRGDARKPAIADWAFARLAAAGIDARDWPQDAFDAYAIAYATREFLRREGRPAAA